MMLEIIFKGTFSNLYFTELKKILVYQSQIRFNYPEIDSNVEEIETNFNIHDYVDFAISSNNFKISEKLIPNVFINLTKDVDYVEMLIFFDLMNLNPNSKNGIDELMHWSANFCTRFNFNSYVCQVDNGGEHEYYFNNEGIGPLYEKNNFC